MFFKSKSHLGIDIGAGGIKLVELRYEKKRPVLFTYGFTKENNDVHRLTNHQIPNSNLPKLDFKTDINTDERTWVDPEKNNNAVLEQPDTEKINNYASTIKALCKASKTIAKSAMVSLPVSAVFHAIVTLPLVAKPEQLKSLLKAELKKFVHGSADDMALDYQVLDSKKEEKTQRVLINAVPNSLIIFYSKVFQTAGLTLEALEPESTALTRSLVGRDQAVTMLIDIGAERTNFFIIDQSIPITHQSIDFGGNKIDRVLRTVLGVESDIIEQIKSDLFNNWPIVRENREIKAEQFLNLFSAVVEPITKEIGVSLELYLRQINNTNKKPEKIILTGGGAFLPYLADYIAEKFKVRCYIGDPWARVVHQQALKPILRGIAPRMSVAIGLALRSMV